MSRYTPRAHPGGRHREVSYRSMETDEDITYNVEQCFGIIQDLLDEVDNLRIEQDKLLTRVRYLETQV